MKEVKHRIKTYQGGKDKIDSLDWIPYLAKAEQEFSDKVLELDWVWEMPSWETCTFLEITEEHSNEVKGRCILGNIPNSNRYGIFAVYVTPKFRKQGVAKALVQYCLDKVKSNKGILEIGTREDNLGMNYLINSFGFELIDKKVSEISNLMENKYKISFEENK